jgi:pyruvate dehydrogenase E1 component
VRGTATAKLARDAREVERRNRLSPLAESAASHIAKCLPGDEPVIVATDYVRAYPQLIASYIDAPFTMLGTDGFGRSDTRAALRSFFEVDRYQVIVASLSALAQTDAIERRMVADAIVRYELSADVPSPWTV